MTSWEGWDSLERNQYLRSLQPDIIINDRSQLAEDFGTPEEHVTATDRDWEACMTFNGLSWGYVDSRQAAPYSYNAQRILRMLQTCAVGCGNLLLNIGPAPDGSVPPEAVEPLTQVGAWLQENGRAAYGKLVKNTGWTNSLFGGNGIASASSDGKSVFLWNWIWPQNGEMGLGGYLDAPRAVRILKDGTPVEFEHKGHRILLKNLPKEAPDKHAGVSVIELEFDAPPRYLFASYYPQLQGGKDIAGEEKI
jgi:alpha-L-fucosidase